MTRTHSGQGFVQFVEKSRSKLTTQFFTLRQQVEDQSSISQNQDSILFRRKK